MTASAPGEPAPAAVEAPSPAQAPRTPGLFRFSVEGRRAPALFVSGWLGTLVGVGLGVVGLLAAPSLVTGLLLLAALALLTVGLVLLGGSQAIERQAGGEAYGGPSPVLLLAASVMATLLVAAILGIVLEALGVSLGPSERPLGDLLSVAIQGLVFVAMVRLMVVGPGALSWSDMGFSADRGRILGGLASGVLLAVPVIAITSLVAYVVVPLVGVTPPSPLPPTGTGSGLALHLVAGAGIAPFAEETIFRGAALTAWLRSVSPTSAIVRSAVLFAATHALQVGGATFGEAAGLMVVATAVRLPVALALGWVCVRTRTIWAPIGLHVSYNAILIALGEVVSQAPV